jgi:hypothetical protein
MFFERGGKRRAFFDVLANLMQNFFEENILLLLRQNINTRDEWQTRVNHHRKLARENG